MKQGRHKKRPISKQTVEYGRRIRFFREQGRLSQLELGGKVGYKSSGSISQIENGLFNVHPDKRVLLAKALRVHPLVLESEKVLSNGDLESLAIFMDILQNPKSYEHSAEIKRLIKSSDRRRLLQNN